MSGKAERNGFECCSRRLFPAWEAEEEGNMMLICNSLDSCDDLGSASNCRI